MNAADLRAACRKAVEDIASDPDAMAALPDSVRAAVSERAEPQPWTIERLRGMTRQEFRACVKRGDLPPAEIAAQLFEERLRGKVLR